MEDRMTSMEHAAWGRTRTMGRWAYVLRCGVLRKGVKFAALVVAAEWIWALVSHVPWRPGQWGLQFLWLAALYGGIIGVIDWSEEEERYLAGPQPEDSSEEDIFCFNCAHRMAAGESRCPACGWSFEDVSASSPPHAEADLPPRDFT